MLGQKPRQSGPKPAGRRPALSGPNFEEVLGRDDEDEHSEPVADRVAVEDPQVCLWIGLNVKD
jgi:hypothetical protein